MASMNRHERALSYVKQLKSSIDVHNEALKIIDEINDLVWNKDKTPLSKEEKLHILDEIKQIIIKGEKTSDGHIIVEASDNSGLLDVIDKLKPKVK